LAKVFRNSVRGTSVVNTQKVRGLSTLPLEQDRLALNQVPRGVDGQVLGISTRNKGNSRCEEDSFHVERG